MTNHPVLEDAADELAGTAIELLAGIHADVAAYNNVVRALTAIDPDHIFDELEFDA